MTDTCLLPASAGDIEMQVQSLVRKIPWRRAQQPTLVFLPGESNHGQRSLVGYSPWGHKESVTIEVPQHDHTTDTWNDLEDVLGDALELKEVRHKSAGRGLRAWKQGCPEIRLHGKMNTSYQI